MLSYFTDHASSPCLPLFSLTISKKKTVGTSHKNTFRMKTSACRDETLKNLPNKMGMIPQYFLPSLHLVPTMPCVSGVHVEGSGVVIHLGVLCMFMCMETELCCG